MDDGPCWGAWLSTWDGVRDDLRRDLRDAREAFALAERLNEDTSANPRATADQRRSAAFDLKRALKHRKSPEAALKLLPCEAYEVAAAEHKWPERGLQKALPYRACARLQCPPQEVHRRRRPLRSGDAPLYRGPGRHGLGHFQRLLPQGRHPLPRQLSVSPKHRNESCKGLLSIYFRKYYLLGKSLACLYP